ncbi:MAG: transposase [Alphaproteobacteria bacterium]|nr:MAG: transposase [Alphaproteobacteria bacterium]
MHKELTSRAFVVHCLDPWRAHRVISTRLNKTDRNDAQGLATLLARGNFPTTHVKSDDARRIRAVLQLRQLLLRKAVDIEHAVRMMRKSLGPPSAASFQSETSAEPLLRNSIELACAASESLREHYASIDRYVKSLAGQHPVCQRLMTVPGVDPMTALTFSPRSTILKGSNAPAT